MCLRRDAGSDTTQGSSQAERHRAKRQEAQKRIKAQERKERKIQAQEQAQP
jgi:hypothetical protein